MQPYPCTSNIPISCTYYQGNSGSYNQIFMLDKVGVTFLDTSYATTPFHIIIPDTLLYWNNRNVYFYAGFYN